MTIVNEKKPTDLKTSDFFYDLPEEQIAQHPMEKRDHSRLMVIDRASGKIEQKHFYDIIDFQLFVDRFVVYGFNIVSHFYAISLCFIFYNIFFVSNFS